MVLLFFLMFRTYSNTSAIFTYNLGYSESFESDSHWCEGEYVVNFFDTTNNSPFTQEINSDNYEDIAANISITSTNCSVSFNATLAITDTVKEHRFFNIVD